MFSKKFLASALTSLTIFLGNLSATTSDKPEYYLNEPFKKQPTISLVQNATFNQFKFDYETLTNTIHKIFERQFIVLQSHTKRVSKEEENFIKDYIKTLDKVIKVSKQRLKMPLAQEKWFKDATEKVYYSAIAVKDTLEFMFDEFYEEIGGFSNEFLCSNDFNIIEIGKGILADIKKQNA